MTISVIINGAKGRMGKEAEQTITHQPEFELVAALGNGDDLAKTIHDTNANIVIELTNANVVYENSKTIIEAGARPVIGATGLNDEQINELQQRCRQLKRGGIIAPNFSIAAVLMMRFAAMAAQHLPQVEIIEKHHDKKLDAPSGTAIKTAKMIAQSQAKVNQPQREEHELYQGSRGGTVENIPIHAIRLPGFLATQEVIFGSTGETLTLCHNSINRQCFMPGVLLACKKVMELEQLVYGLENVIEG